jgi:hypothetical protein
VLEQLFDRAFLPFFAYDHYNVELHAYISPDYNVFNTANDLTYVYWEDGEIGLSIYMHVLGVLASYVFVRAVRNRRILDAQLLAILMTTLVMNARGIYFSAVGFWAAVLLQAALLRHLQEAPAGAAETINASRVTSP